MSRLSIIIVFLASLLCLGRVYKGSVTLYSVGDDDLYWSFPRSLVYDGDLNMADEPLPTFRSQPDTINFASPFPGLLWTPAVVAGRAIGPFLEEGPGMTRAEIQGGYSIYQRLLVSAFSACLTLMGLFFIYQMLLRFVAPINALFGSLVLLLGTPLFYYTFRRPLMSHSAEIFALGAFALATVRLFEKPTFARALLSGFLGALAVGIRYPDGFVVASWFLAVWLTEKTIRRPGLWCVGVLAGILLPVMFQMLEWKWMRDTFLPTSGIYSMHPQAVGHLLRWDSETPGRILNLFIGAGWGVLWLETSIVLAFAAAFRKPWGRPEKMLAILLLGLIPLALIAANFPNQGDSYAYRYLLAKGLWLALGVALFMSRLDSIKRQILVFIAVVAPSIVALLLFESGPDTLTLAGVPGSGWSNPTFAQNAFSAMLHQPAQFLFALMGTPVGHFALFILAKLGILAHLPEAIHAKAMLRVETIPFIPFLWFIFCVFSLSALMWMVVTKSEKKFS